MFFVLNLSSSESSHIDLFITNGKRLAPDVFDTFIFIRKKYFVVCFEFELLREQPYWFVHYQWKRLAPDVFDTFASHSDLQNSEAVWKSRWLSWAPVPNKPMVSVDVKWTLHQHFDLVNDVTDIYDCWAQNGNTCSYIFTILTCQMLRNRNRNQIKTAGCLPPPPHLHFPSLTFPWVSRFGLSVRR